LSGGERQRIAIARAVLKQARVLLFDEGTSSLDGRTEFQVLRNLACLSPGRTTLVVAHRLATIVNADVIVVLHEGRLVESGTHAQLLRLRGHYSALWRAQHPETSTGT
jgi:ABC-type multidrug transport system fused ATPase/permease subunit